MYESRVSVWCEHFRHGATSAGRWIHDRNISQPHLRRFQIRAVPRVIAEAALIRCRKHAHRHGHEESSPDPMIVVMRRGMFRYHVGRRAVLADVNSTLLFHPDEPYSISHPTDHGDDCVALRFSMDTVTDALGAASGSAHAWILDHATQRAIQRAAADALTAPDSLAREERALDVLNLIGNAQPLTRNSKDASRVEAVRERLAADPGANPALAEIAVHVGLSPFHFARCFRAHTGTSLHQYRLSLRLGLAMTALRDGETNLTQLGLDLGFASASHFSTAFRRAYGVSPRAACRLQPG
jgi:AraC family transcriptional regulator